MCRRHHLPDIHTSPLPTHKITFQCLAEDQEFTLRGKKAEKLALVLAYLTSQLSDASLLDTEADATTTTNTTEAEADRAPVGKRATKSRLSALLDLLEVPYKGRESRDDLICLGRMDRPLVLAWFITPFF